MSSLGPESAKPGARYSEERGFTSEASSCRTLQTVGHPQITELCRAFLPETTTDSVGALSSEWT